MRSPFFPSKLENCIKKYYVWSKNILSWCFIFLSRTAFWSVLGIQHRFYSRRQKSPDAFSTFKSCQKSNQNEIPHAFLSIKRSEKILGVYVLPEHENVSLMCFQLYLEKSPCVPFFKNFFTVSICPKKVHFFLTK